MEIRRQPTSETGDPGAMTPHAARELAALLTRAADQADGLDTRDHEAVEYAPIERPPPPHPPAL